MKWNDKYFVYYVPQRKIGATHDLEDRVTRQQGFAEGEYEVLHEVNNIFIASYLEKQEQEQRGYRVDNCLYFRLFTDKNLSMKTKSTKLTTGFKINTPEEFDIVFPEGETITIETPLDGTLVFDTEEKRQWIKDNLIATHSGEDWHLPYYIKNKVAKNYLNNLENTQLSSINEDNWSIQKIEGWHKDKGILDKSSLQHQALKISEEYGELAKAIIKDQGLDKIQDALGDMFVVMVSVAKLAGTDINTCIQIAWDEIKDRPGKMVGEDFRKDGGVSY